MVLLQGEERGVHEGCGVEVEEGAGMFQAAYVLSMVYVGFILQAMGTDYYPKLSGVASGVFRYLTLPGVFLSLAFLFVIRPVAGALAVSRSGLKQPAAWAVGFLGVRGIGSFYYLAYGQRHGDFHELGPLWATVAFTVLLSIVIHGIAAPRILRHLEGKEAQFIPGGYGEKTGSGVQNQHF